MLSSVVVGLIIQTASRSFGTAPSHQLECFRSRVCALLSHPGNYLSNLKQLFHASVETSRETQHFNSRRQPWRQLSEGTLSAALISHACHTAADTRIATRPECLKPRVLFVSICFYEAWELSTCVANVRNIKLAPRVDARDHVTSRDASARGRGSRVVRCAATLVGSPAGPFSPRGPVGSSRGPDLAVFHSKCLFEVQIGPVEPH